MIVIQLAQYTIVTKTLSKSYSFREQSVLSKYSQIPMPILKVKNHHIQTSTEVHKYKAQDNILRSNI